LAIDKSSDYLARIAMIDIETGEIQFGKPTPRDLPSSHAQPRGALSPTYTNFGRLIKSCDIGFISVKLPKVSFGVTLKVSQKLGFAERTFRPESSTRQKCAL
jgi:hypothetical protein